MDNLKAEGEEFDARRDDAFKAVREEREYQDQAWDDVRTVGEYLVFMRHYLGKAEAALTENPYPQAEFESLDEIRKIAALGLAALEHNGVVHRK